MTFLRQTLLMAGFLNIWLTAPIDVHAQGVSSAATSLQAWRSTSQGLSSNAALAFYRVQNIGHPNQQNSVWRRQQFVPNTTIYSAPYYAVTTHRSVTAPRSSYYPTSTSRQTQKPFSDVRPAPTAFERYWPLLLEAREDPQTGLVIWTLP